MWAESDLSHLISMILFPSLNYKEGAVIHFCAKFWLHDFTPNRFCAHDFTRTRAILIAEHAVSLRCTQKNPCAHLRLLFEPKMIQNAQVWLRFGVCRLRFGVWWLLFGSGLRSGGSGLEFGGYCLAQVWGLEAQVWSLVAMIWLRFEVWRLRCGVWWLLFGSGLRSVCCWLLAAGCWVLAGLGGCWLGGCWLLAAGCWLLTPGFWLLAAGPQNNTIAAFRRDEVSQERLPDQTAEQHCAQNKPRMTPGCR